MTLTPSTPPGGNQSKNHPALTSLLTSCKNGAGGGGGGEGDTLPRGQDATHTGQQHVRMERLPLPNAGKGHGDRMGGNAGPRTGLLTPKGTPDARDTGRLAGRKAPRSLKGRSCIVPGKGASPGQRQVTEGRRPLSSDSTPPGTQSGSPGPRLGGGAGGAEPPLPR